MKKKLFCSIEKKYFAHHKCEPTRGAGQKNYLNIKLRGRTTRPALCGPKRGVGQNEPGWPALPSLATNEEILYMHQKQILNWSGLLLIYIMYDERVLVVVGVLVLICNIEGCGHQCRNMDKKFRGLKLYFYI